MPSSSQNANQSGEDDGQKEVISKPDEKKQDGMTDQPLNEPRNGQPNNDPQQEQEQQQQYPGAYAVRGINSVPNTNPAQGLQKDHLQAANGVDNLEDKSVDNILETTVASSNTETTNASAADTTTASNTADTTGIIGNNTSSMATTDSSMGGSTGGGGGTANSGTASGGTASTTQPLSETTARTELLLTASVVREDETLDRERLIAETEARVRREISDRGGPENITGISIVEAKEVKNVDSQNTKKQRRNRIIVATTILLLVAIGIVTFVSIRATSTKNNLNSTSDSSNETLDTNTTTLPTEKLPAAKEEEDEVTNYCVQEKLQNWVEMATPLQEYLDEIMATDVAKEVVQDCQTEIRAINEAGERSCRLEKEHNSPWNYGDLWISSIAEYKAMNKGSWNGALYLNGHYRLATILDLTMFLTEVFPPPFSCYADCYTAMGGGCEGNTPNASTWSVEPDGIFVSPEMYCQIEWAALDQAYIDLKNCAADSSTNVDSEYYSNQVYKFAFDFEKRENEKCSQAYCTTEPPLPHRTCGPEKTKDFVNGGSWLKEYFDGVFSYEKYKIANKSCRNEIKAFTEISENSCELETQFNATWNYGDRWLATSNFYMALNNFEPNGAVYTDGDYLLAILFDETFNFTIPIMKPQICLADCYTGQSWNGENNTCDFLDAVPPEEFNPLNLENFYESQSTISAQEYCDIDWESIDQAFIELKICAAKAVGEPLLITLEEYVCFFEYEKLRQKKCSEYYCDKEAFDDFDTTLEEYCQITPEQLDMIYSWSQTDWIR